MGDGFSQFLDGAPAPSSDGFDQFLDTTPQTPPGIGRVLKMIGTNLAGGAANAADSMANAETSLQTGALPTEMPASQGAKTAGLADRADTQPQNWWERLIAGGARGVGAAGPIGLVSVPAVASTVLGGAGGAEGADLWPAHPDLGALIGGTMGGMTGAGVASAGARAVNAARGATTDLGTAFDTAGVAKNFPGTFSDNPFWSQITSYAQKNLGSAGVIQRAAKSTLDDFGNSVEATARGIEGTPAPMATSIDRIGGDAQNAARLWMWGADKPTPGATGVMEDNIADAFKPIDTTIPQTAPVWLNGYKQALTGSADMAGRLQATAKALQGTQSETLLNSIAVDLPNGRPATWTEAQQLRRMIGDAMGTPDIVQSMGTKQLRALYAGVSNDMRTTAGRFDMADVFDRANQYATGLYNFRDNLLTNLVGAGNPLQETITPARAGNWLYRNLNDATLVGKLREQLPPVADAAAAFKLRDMAAATAGQQNAEGTAVSPRSFLTDWNRLPPEARSALYPDAMVRGKVDALATVSEKLKNVFSLANTSNTQPSNAMHQLLEGIAAIAGGHMLGGEAGTAGMIYGGARATMPAFNAAVGRIAANRWLANLMAARGLPGPTAGNVVRGATAAAPTPAPALMPP